MPMRGSIRDTRRCSWPHFWKLDGPKSDARNKKFQTMPLWSLGHKFKFILYKAGYIRPYREVIRSYMKNNQNKAVTLSWTVSMGRRLTQLPSLRGIWTINWWPSICALQKIHAFSHGTPAGVRDIKDKVTSLWKTEWTSIWCSSFPL